MKYQTAMEKALGGLPWQRLKVLYLVSQFVPSNEMGMIDKVYSLLGMDSFTDEQLKRWRTHMENDQKQRLSILTKRCMICRIETTNKISRCRHLMCNTCAVAYANGDCEVCRRSGTVFVDCQVPSDFICPHQSSCFC